VTAILTLQIPNPKSKIKTAPLLAKEGWQPLRLTGWFFLSGPGAVATGFFNPNPQSKEGVGTAQAEGNTEEIIKYARLLFIDGFRHEQDYYGLLQEHVDPDQWAEFVEELIHDLTVRRGAGEYQLAGIYIKEGMWKRLLELVKRSPSFYTLDAYEKYLKKDYASELAEMYAEAVIEYLEETYNAGRKHYQNACRYIRRIKKLGSPELAERVILTLREKYPRRPSLLEELEMV
jgi:hypothetical protein